MPSGPDPSICQADPARGGGLMTSPLIFSGCSQATKPARPAPFPGSTLLCFTLHRERPPLLHGPRVAPCSDFSLTSSSASDTDSDSQKWFCLLIGTPVSPVRSS